MKQKDELKTQTQNDIADFLSNCVVGPVKQELSGVARQDALDRIEKATAKGGDDISAGLAEIKFKINDLPRTLNDLSDKAEAIENKIGDSIPEIVKDVTNNLADQLPNIHSKLETIIKGETAHLDTQFEKSEAAVNRVHKALEKAEQEQLDAVEAFRQAFTQEADDVRQRIDGVSGILQENTTASNGLYDEAKVQLDKLTTFSEKYRTLLIASLSIGTVNLIGIVTLILLHLT